MENTLSDLDSYLKDLGFKYTKTYSRPKGTAKEYVSGLSYFYCEEEGGSLGFDLIVQNSDFGFRMDLNGLMWESGMRFSRKNTEASKHEGFYLQWLRKINIMNYLDTSLCHKSKHCFPLTKQEVAEYINNQRGNSECA